MQLLPEAQHFEHRRARRVRSAIVLEEPATVRADPHVHLLVDEEAGAGEIEAVAVGLAVAVGVDGQLLELFEPLGPGGRRLVGVESSRPVEILAIDDQIRADRVRQSPIMSTVIVELADDGVDVLLPDRLDHLVDRDEQPLRRERALDVGLAVGDVRRGAGGECRLHLGVEITPGDRLLLDPDARVGLLERRDDLLDHRHAARVRLGVRDARGLGRGPAAGEPPAEDGRADDGRDARAPEHGAFSLGPPCCPLHLSARGGAGKTVGEGRRRPRALRGRGGSRRAASERRDGGRGGGPAWARRRTVRVRTGEDGGEAMGPPMR